MKQQMETMERRQLIIAMVAVVIAAAGLISFLAIKPMPVSQSNPENGSPSPPGVSTAIKSKTWAPVPADEAVVPDASAKDVPKGIAIPDMVFAASIGAEASLRFFTISLDKGVFSPDIISLKEGDTARIMLTAVDKSYDFAQPDNGLKAPLPKGVGKIIGFSGMNPGKFTFYCSSCGGPSKGPVGYFIVVPK